MLESFTESFYLLSIRNHSCFSDGFSGQAGVGERTPFGLPARVSRSTQFGPATRSTEASARIIFCPIEPQPKAALNLKRETRNQGLIAGAEKALVSRESSRFSYRPGAVKLPDRNDKPHQQICDNPISTAIANDFCRNHSPPLFSGLLARPPKQEFRLNLDRLAIHFHHRIGKEIDGAGSGLGLDDQIAAFA